jgi:hypothetical protein
VTRGDGRGVGRTPHVYGLQVGSVTTGATATRLGGASLSAYNWEINATNVRQASAHLNQALGVGGEPGAAVSQALTEASTNGGLALLTVPIGGYVAADAAGDDVLSTANHLTTRFEQNVAVKGTAFESPPDTTDGVVYQDEFVDWVKGQAGTTPVVFSLDNEPSLWQLDHVAFHPAMPTYDEVVSRSVEFASAVKGAWPEAGVSGPVSYGWLGMRTLQDAGLAGGPDVSKGDFLEYYLDRLSSAEGTLGTRLLDYLDFHWWPEIYVGGIRIIEDDASPEVVQARLQAPRSLWDAGYVEDSWITGAVGGPINLIPRMKATIAAHYPGTKLALSAWDYGGGGDISGALVAADVLGILGREGVDLATASPVGQTQFTFAAFKAFLDYDGSGARFGDTSVAATTSDRLGSSVYASIDSGTPASVTVVAINKRAFARDVTIAISSSTAYTSVDVWELTAAGATFVSDAALPATGSNTFAYRMPAMSIAVLVPHS